MYMTDVEALKKEYEEFKKNEVSFSTQYIHEIYRFGQNHASLMLQLYGHGVSQFETDYALLCHVLEKLNYHEKVSWPNHRGVQYFLFIHNMKNLFASFDLCNRGFSEGALTLVRPVFEATIYVAYISCYPDKPYRFLSKHPIAVQNFLETELKLGGWVVHYQILSSFVHGNQTEIMKEIQRIGTRSPVVIKYEYNEKLTELCMMYMHHAMYFMARFIDKYMFTTPNERIDQKHKTALQHYIALEEAARTTNPNPYWRNIGKDFDHLFGIIDTSEKGGDWKKDLKLQKKNKKRQLLQVLHLISQKGGDI